MHMIGHWPETIYDDFCFPQELPLCSDAALRSSLVSYLQSGRVDTKYRRGYSYCRYGCGISRRGMGAADRTDGTWVWPEGLAHYVEEHHISLPSAFVANALRNEPPPPPPVLSAPHEHWRSSELWSSWCEEQRSDRSRALIHELKAKCEAEIEVRLTEHFDQVAREKGTADRTCIWAGCHLKALKGIVFCARHLVSGTNDVHQDMIASSVRDEYTREFLKTLTQADD